MIGLSEEAAGSLMDGGDGGLIEEVVLDACDGEMVAEVVLHILAVDAFEMASGDDSGGEGLRGSVGELVDDTGLTCQDDGKVGFGVAIELGEDMKLCEDIETDEGCLVDDEDGLHLFAQHQFPDLPVGSGWVIRVREVPELSMPSSPRI